MKSLVWKSCQFFLSVSSFTVSCSGYHFTFSWDRILAMSQGLRFSYPAVLFLFVLDLIVSLKLDDFLVYNYSSSYYISITSWLCAESYQTLSPQDTQIICSILFSVHLSYLCHRHNVFTQMSVHFKFFWTSFLHFL